MAAQFEIRNYKFRLYPTQQQENRLLQTLEGCRWLYNYFLKNDLAGMSKQDMQFTLVELKEQKPWLRNYHSKMLQMVVHKIDSARKTLATLREKGYKTGNLHCLAHEEYNSFTYNQSGFKIERHGNTDLLWLSKIGYVEIRLHREPKNIKQITTCRQNGRWYAVIACEISKPILKFINPTKAVGIDVGITRFAYDSDNRRIDNPLFLNKLLRPLRRAHRRLSRRQKGNNYLKAKHMLARLHQRTHNKRRDFLHKLSRHYASKYDIIFLERLCTLNMVKNHHLARHVLDSGWRTFKRILEYKAKMVAEVEPINTSVDCSRCGKSS